MFLPLDLPEIISCQKDRSLHHTPLIAGGWALPLTCVANAPHHCDPPHVCQSLRGEVKHNSHSRLRALRAVLVDTCGCWMVPGWGLQGAWAENRLSPLKPDQGLTEPNRKGQQTTSAAARISLQRSTGWAITFFHSFSYKKTSSLSSSPSGPVHRVQQGWC